MIAADLYVHGYDNKEQLQGQLICIISSIYVSEMIL